MGEFCAHEDEENQSEELARRLHLLPPVCVDQRSHMQIESPWCVFCFFFVAFPPAQQSFSFFLPGSLFLSALQLDFTSWLLF